MAFPGYVTEPRDFVNEYEQQAIDAIIEEERRHVA